MQESLPDANSLTIELIHRSGSFRAIEFDRAISITGFFPESGKRLKNHR